ncbi:tRNA (N6-threonylcarbamoyladenosine(37)-N6)-methyltransferase TrmO [Dialister invisus]|jgi:tRNA-Thr(GGU) m(6)t(6)A37 methyltransferase TsaA|uniref:tRNA (N6-threonylcarbamoyladenosine(37)-N6)-methyltransferase TrmO n=1 Tax=Dialister invisus TaxID=218538 RepID=UPI0023A7D4F6|nr:tRNA (N6-threonylcarbamoyladenosine(37)-N6)-methyltransferase TrmO [Dialister invisus]MBS5030733.1 tRNA (N6-threonylcarbamoyladenosine(37)-N6)-methyltransferase TrmO [Dialister invisus]
MELKEIGKIHSPYKTVKEAPRQGKLSDKFCEIEIFSAYEAALLHADEEKYYVVLYFAHEADRTALQTVPPWAKEPYGVFASRSPHRPNPINLCVVKLVRREKNRLFVIGLDAIDGSSLIDIKPYVKELDEAEV